MSQDEKPSASNQNADMEVVGDHVLQTLVNLVNRSGISFGITLHVGGGIICGELVSGAQFFEQSATRVSGPAQWAEVVDTVKELIRNFGKPYENGAEKVTNPKHLHLKDARFYSPGAAPLPSNGIFWRGRISEVSGFSLGTFDHD